MPDESRLPLSHVTHQELLTLHTDVSSSTKALVALSALLLRHHPGPLPAEHAQGVAHLIDGVLLRLGSAEETAAFVAGRPQ